MGAFVGNPSLLSLWDVGRVAAHKANQLPFPPESSPKRERGPMLGSGEAEAGEQ